MRNADVEKGQRTGTTAAEAAELWEGGKRIRVLEQENEILRRAAIYLGRGTLPKWRIPWWSIWLLRGFR